jgi:hypothetical protein
MRGKTDISGFDYHDGNQAQRMGTSSRLPSGPMIVDRGSGAHVITLPSRSRPGAGCLSLVNRGAKELMTAVRVSELDGMFAPSPSPSELPV